MRFKRGNKLVSVCLYNCREECCCNHPHQKVFQHSSLTKQIAEIRVNLFINSFNHIWTNFYVAAFFFVRKFKLKKRLNYYQFYLHLKCLKNLHLIQLKLTKTCSRRKEKLIIFTKSSSHLEL